jgi:hypothetical protein
MFDRNQGKVFWRGRTLDVMGKVTGYYKEECARDGWQPEPHQIIYRAIILIAETGETAQHALARYPRQPVFPLKSEVAPRCWNSITIRG